MSDFVETDVRPLYVLKKQLLIFKDETEHMQIKINEEICDFEKKMKMYYSQMALVPGWDTCNDDFKVLWNKYINNRDIFVDRINKLLQHEVISINGMRNIYTLIIALEEYFNAIP